MAEPAGPNRWSRPTAEAAVVLTALLLAFAAGVAGFVVGRETAEEEPAAAETTTAPETTAATETIEPETTTTETATEAETETETEAETETEGGEADGAAVFSEACATCHTFEPAGSSGTIGPPLDGIDLSKDEIATQVRNGGGGMPAFEGQLSDAEIDAVSDFVESG
jgi:mono/diheme cytochrome c family protein